MGTGEDVTLFGDGGAHWERASPLLFTARLLVLCVVTTGPLLAVALLAVLTPWHWLGWLALVVLGAAAWAGWVIRRQVSAISYAETLEELVVRRGRIFRSLVSVPYGRLQFVDMQSGPLARHFGLATLEMHTASPETKGRIPGVPLAEAEALRERLTVRGESQRAGL